MQFLWVVGNDRTVFGWVTRYLVTHSQIYRTNNNEPDSNTTMHFRLRIREKERWITMMNNSARQSCETVFNWIITWQEDEELSEMGGQCQHASATPVRTAFVTVSALHALSPTIWRPTHTLAFCRLRNLSQPLSNPSHPKQRSIPQKH
jgi:hypothetical protein